MVAVDLVKVEPVVLVVAAAVMPLEDVEVMVVPVALVVPVVMVAEDPLGYTPMAVPGLLKTMLLRPAQAVQEGPVQPDTRAQGRPVIRIVVPVGVDAMEVVEVPEVPEGQAEPEGPDSRALRVTVQL